MGLTARDILKAGSPIALPAVTLVPIVRTRIIVTPMGDRVVANATSALSAVVVRERAGDRVLDWDGEPRTLDVLRETVAGLGQALGG